MRPDTDQHPPCPCCRSVVMLARVDQDGGYHGWDCDDCLQRWTTEQVIAFNKAEALREQAERELDLAV